MNVDRYLNNYRNGEHGGPNFHWNHPLNRPHDENATPNGIVDRVKEVVNSITSTTSSLFITSTEIVPESTTNSATGVLADEVTTFGSIFNESATTAEMLPSETTTSSGFIEEMISNSNSTILDEMVGSKSNGTVFDEMVGSNSNSSDGGAGTTTFATDIMETTISTTKSFIENATDFMNGPTTTETDIHATTTEENGAFGPLDSIESSTLYIIIGITLGVFLLLVVILIIIYAKYKYGKWRSTSGAYCVTDLREISTSSEENMRKFVDQDSKSPY